VSQLSCNEVISHRYKRCFAAIGKTESCSHILSQLRNCATISIKSSTYRPGSGRNRDGMPTAFLRARNVRSRMQTLRPVTVNILLSNISRSLTWLRLFLSLSDQGGRRPRSYGYQKSEVSLALPCIRHSVVQETRCRRSYAHLTVLRP
jgi:hypothetical protein